MRRKLWFLFLAALGLTLGLKAAQLGWFAQRPPLALDGEAALLFFNKSRGCACEMFVYNHANAQLEAWGAPVRVIPLDLDRRPDLAREFNVIRAPTLILLNPDRLVVWRQDVGLSDEAPLDLDQVEIQVRALGEPPQ